MRLIGFVIACVTSVILYGAMVDAVTSPELTARYQVAQRERTARALAAEETARVQAVELGDTLRTMATWAGGVVAVAVVAGAAGWTVVQWQREGTKRHTTSEQARVLIAYRDVFGGRLGTWDGAPVIYLDDSREIITPETALLELRQARLTVDA